MPLRVMRLDSTIRPAFERLLAEIWGQTWDEELARALVQWRYDERVPAGETWVAMDGEQCVALVDSFVRPYLLDGRRIAMRETCDWYCLPRYRPLGVGIRLVRQLMACPEPLISIGGSETNLAILPRLGWAELPTVERFLLPIRARNLTGTWLRTKWPAHEGLAKAIPRFIPLRPARPAPPPAGGIPGITDWSPGTAAPLPIPERGGLVELLSAEDLAWMTRIPRRSRSRLASSSP
ncbi:hypothetical protein [Dankookia sp. P2]|uniref:hypothetical protein n=1 Tax=Dankookia sp. P2 TaxID=3423955 RepID=UPI003D676B27